MYFISVSDFLLNIGTERFVVNTVLKPTHNNIQTALEIIFVTICHNTEQTN